MQVLFTVNAHAEFAMSFNWVTGKLRNVDDNILK